MLENDAMAGKTIGETNGRWGVLFRVVLVLVPLMVSLSVPLGAWLVVNQVRDNEFRNAGDRWTATQANAQTKAIIAEVMLAWKESLREHEMLHGHAVISQRVLFLERMMEGAVMREADAEVDETEILREMQADIREYIKWLKANQ